MTSTPDAGGIEVHNRFQCKRIALLNAAGRRLPTTNSGASMPIYKFILHSGQALTAVDKRSLSKLSEDLCSAGFIVVQRTGSGYSNESKPVSLLERAVAQIEPLD
jgi:hypothetical protein